MIERATGALASIPDYRDKYLGSLIGGIAETVNLPASFETDLSKFPVMDQNKVPACVSHAWALMMKIYWYRKTGEVIDFSPRFLDILSSEPGFPIDGGRRPRTVAKISVTLGCCTTKTLKNDTALSNAKYRDPLSISKAAYEEAAKYRLPGYIKVPVDKTSMRTAVQLYGAVSTLFSVGKELYTPSWSPWDINPLRTPVVQISGHQMVVKGWSELYNRLRNCWSIDWCQQGEALYGPNAWGPFTYEAWVPAEIPEDIATFLKTLPSPTSFFYDFARMPNLTKGQYNDDVRAVQIALMIRGYLAPVQPGEFGVYGNKTAAAVLAYQTKRGISPTAADSVGLKTRTALATDFPL